MTDRTSALMAALNIEYGCKVTVVDSDGDRHVRLVVSDGGGRDISLATISRIQQTCVEHGYDPHVSQTIEDGRTLLVDCRAGRMVRETVDRVVLDEDGLLVKLAGDTIHCIALPDVGSIARRRLLMMRAGDDVTIRLLEDEQGRLVVDELRNHSLGDV